MTLIHNGLRLTSRCNPYIEDGAYVIEMEDTFTRKYKVVWTGELGADREPVNWGKYTVTRI